MGPRRRSARILLAGATACTAFVVAPGAGPDPVAEAAPDDIVAIVIDGVGNGHGRGMSQWGAYGYSVDHGWDWNQILAHYYGGTVSATTSAGQRISVRLTKYDGMSEVGVISHGSPVRWGSASGRSMRAVETTQGTFDIYASSQIACPGGTSITVPNGPVVQSGSFSAGAQQVQQFLDRYHDSAIAVDGYFGNQTVGFLASWQQAQGLPVNGARWDQDDATRARQIIGSATGSVSWNKVGTHVQSAGNPVRFTSIDGESGSTDRGDVLGVCSSGGAVTHYRGAVEVLSSSDGNRVVSDVGVEGYVRGVIPKEIAASWAYANDGAGANAVRAQAVAARSYGLSQNRSYTYPGSSTRYASTCDTTSCQVYGGSATRSSANGSVTNVEHVATDAAVLATANVVRRWPAGHPSAGQIVSTEFSASNGPRTAGGAFPPVDDIGDDTPSNPLHRWTRIIDADTFAAQNGLGSITGASMEPTTASNYQGFDGVWFDDIVITGTSGTYRKQAWDFRNAMGYSSPGMTVRVIRESTTSSSMAFIGDSVGNGITADNGAFRKLTDGTFTSQTIDAVDSRCTTKDSCPGTSGVQAANALPSGLDLVVVELGYNDNPATFGSDVDAMMTALTAKGVKRVAWVNMADIRRSNGNLVYTPANAALSAATSRWGNLAVLDWNASSNTPERSRWFNSDGVHLTATGSAEFSLFLRDQLVGLAPSSYLSPPRRIELPVVGSTMTAPDGRTVTIPADAAGVSLNVTMVRPASGGFATVWPCQQERPEVSSLNARSGEIVANNVIAPISATGTVCFYSSVGTNFLVDIAGWFAGASSSDSTAPFVGLLPQRRVDTRSGIGRTTQVTPSSPLVVPVTGLAAQLPDGTAVTVPSDAAAVAVNVTIARATAGGFATVWPCGTTRPLASNVNFEAGNPTGNGVVAPVGADGTICVHTSATADVIVDLAGYFDGSGPDGADATALAGATAFTPATPTRLVDTRDGTGAADGRVEPGTTLRVGVRGASLDVDESTGGSSTLTVPADAAAVAMNVTVAAPSGRGFAAVWPCGSPQPTASNLNYVAGQNRANSVIAPIGADGDVCISVSASANVIVDVAGWFRGGSAASFVGAVPERLVDTRIALGPVPA
ncbi:MAG: SpoIID/LytB domain-containing protein [Ilumatobacter sp.]|uniref:SpoIID/LytB domain-containing protein n=1 Tax=Ilumatobacter sp. TaxID=1967498 RepID=UPI003298E121